jgi:hypothetical protein
MLRSFILELEGSEEELGRVLSAIYSEMARIREEEMRNAERLTYGIPPRTLFYAMPLTTLRGTFTFKEDVQL